MFENVVAESEKIKKKIYIKGEILKIVSAELEL